MAKKLKCALFNGNLRRFNLDCIKLFFINYICAIIKDTQYFNSYFINEFTKSFKYLPLIKCITMFLMAVFIQTDAQSHLSVLSSINRGDLVIEGNLTFYFKYPLCLFLIAIVYEYLISIYIIVFHVDRPVKNVFFQVVKKTTLLVIAIVTNTFIYSCLPFTESSDVTNFVHTETPFGRGFDYAQENFRLKIKGEFVSSALGSVDMLRAIDKHSPGNRVINSATLFDIIQDPEFKPKIEASISENQFIYLCKEVF